MEKSYTHRNGVPQMSGRHFLFNMNYWLALSILITGLSGLIAQVLLLRELLISFQGNELTIGIILSNWLISEAIGVFIFGKIADKIENKTCPDLLRLEYRSRSVGINIFIILQIFFSLTLPISIYLIRAFKYFLGIPVQETIGLPLIFISSLAVIFMPAFTHAGLFSCGCKIASLYSRHPSYSIAKIYALEITGTVLGGIILTYLLQPYFNSFQIVFMLSLVNLFICLFILNPRINRILKYTVLIFIFIIIYLFHNGSINRLHQLSINKQFKTNKILDYRNSIYGNVALTKKEGQYTLFYNGIPSITLPFGDITFIEEFGNLPLLFHKQPQEVLIISGGIGGLINEILKYPIKKIDYVELDPLVIKTIKKTNLDLIKKELNNKKVQILNKDARFYVQNTTEKYDVILIGLSKPVDLSSNRLFTSQFFSLLKKRLNPDGVISFTLPGSLSYLSQELKNLNACILNAVKQNYIYTRVIPGDYNLFLASDSKEIIDTTAQMITDKINKLGIQTNLLIYDYLNYRMDKKWTDWFKQSLNGATSEINQDTKPYAVFQMLIYWNKQFSHHISNMLENFKNLNIIHILLFILILTILIFFIFNHYPKLIKLNIVYSILTTGFFGMLINLILIFSFQITHGYLYQAIGILISTFMSGASIGSIAIIFYARAKNNPLDLFIKLEIITIIFSFITALIITLSPVLPYFIFIMLFIISGIIIGGEFALASKIYLSNNKRIGETAGLLYFSDLIGGSIAGIIGGIILIPILGLFYTFICIIFIKLSGLLLLLLPKSVFSNI